MCLMTPCGILSKRRSSPARSPPERPRPPTRAPAGRTLGSGEQARAPGWRDSEAQTRPGAGNLRGPRADRRTDGSGRQSHTLLRPARTGERVATSKPAGWGGKLAAATSRGGAGTERLAGVTRNFWGRWGGYGAIPRWKISISAPRAPAGGEGGGGRGGQPDQAGGEGKRHVCEHLEEKKAGKRGGGEEGGGGVKAGAHLTGPEGFRSRCRRF